MSLSICAITRAINNIYVYIWILQQYMTLTHTLNEEMDQHLKSEENYETFGCDNTEILGRTLPFST